MSARISDTLSWAEEVERALLAILWWHPLLIGLVRRELDPSIHLTLPKHRYILEAIEIAFREIGDVTWETVVQVILEIPKAFDECGGKEGLNEVYTDQGHYPSGPRNPEPIVAEYIRFLKACAIQQESIPLSRSCITPSAGDFCDATSWRSRPSILSRPVTHTSWVTISDWLDGRMAMNK